MVQFTAQEENAIVNGFGERDQEIARGDIPTLRIPQDLMSHIVDAALHIRGITSNIKPEEKEEHFFSLIKLLEPEQYGNQSINPKGYLADAIKKENNQILGFAAKSGEIELDTLKGKIYGQGREIFLARAEKELKGNSRAEVLSNLNKALDMEEKRLASDPKGQGPKMTESQMAALALVKKAKDSVDPKEKEDSQNKAIAVLKQTEQQKGKNSGYAAHAVSGEVNKQVEAGRHT